METIRNIFVYKMTTDNGGAPCVWRRVLSLAICKPMIRRRAERGDSIFGFGGKTLGNRLIYAAVVTDKPECGTYYFEERYSRRPDCIYSRNAERRAELRNDADFHNDPSAQQVDRDVGPNFERAYVLLSDDFRYFGNNPLPDYADRFPRVANLVRELGRGHRVNYGPSVVAELVELKEHLWHAFPKMKNGEASHGDRSRRCNTESTCAAIAPEQE